MKEIEYLESLSLRELLYVYRSAVEHYHDCQGECECFIDLPYKYYPGLVERIILKKYE